MEEKNSLFKHTMIISYYQNDAEITKKTLGNLSKSVSFQKLVGFIMNGTFP